MKAELNPGPPTESTESKQLGEGGPGVIVRISNEGQYRLDDGHHARLDGLDNAVVQAVESEDEDGFHAAFEAAPAFRALRGRAARRRRPRAVRVHPPAGRPHALGGRRGVQRGRADPRPRAAQRGVAALRSAAAPSPARRRLSAASRPRRPPRAPRRPPRPRPPRRLRGARRARPARCGPWTRPRTARGRRGRRAPGRRGCRAARCRRPGSAVCWLSNPVRAR